MSNRLAGEPSAYLRQHADNPVHWRAFGDDAFAEAESRDVPVFLSIGYAACHWCHVMAGESFEDEETARYLNANFVSIKVDREERPDVDAAYMNATQMMTGQGGWPMSVFLTPDGRAFFTGTYFPPQPAPGMASFRQVLEAVQDAWTNRRTQVESSADQLARKLAEGLDFNRNLLGRVNAAGDAGPADSTGPAVQLPEPGEDPATEAVQVLLRDEDPEYGGFGNAPKFPPSPVLAFLLNHAAGTSSTAADAAGLASRILEAMASSALYDQLAGGFARYTVDRKWSVPHFEKMLYDNVQLLRLYARWSRLPGPHRQLAGRIAGETAEWMLSELSLPGDAFASSLDADTVVGGEHVEGGSYIWSPAGLADVLGDDDGGKVADLMGVAEAGTVTATGSALHPGTVPDGDDARLWERVRPELLEARRHRVQPARDEKVVAGWNGLAVAALAEAGAILDRPELVAAARRTAVYLAEVHMDDDGSLFRVSHRGRAGGIAGLLEDHAFCAEGFLALYAATGEHRWFDLASRLLSTTAGRFLVDGQLQDSSSESPRLRNAQGGTAAVDPVDNVAPSGTAAFAQALLTESAYSGSAPNRTLATDLLRYAGRLAGKAPRAVGSALAALEAAGAGPVQIAITGTESDERQEMIRTAWECPSPGLALAVEKAGETPVPLLVDRPAGPDGRARAYVCRDMLCRLPADTVGQLREQLEL
ncbi:thioredoxin domain-containing protein [Arthrobacter castelli]|uniref:thioredoxin domain-containing protein n=1 Tax=Arthrobacter castelli TaxID=271431 RepID=UPI000418AF09|nr:thioredoxin domain-containing protein [Arthrobacter castelli]